MHEQGNYQILVPKSGRISQGTFKQVIFIYARTINPTTPNQMEPSMVFTPQYTVMGRVEEIRPVERIDHVNVLSGEEATHKIFIDYDPNIYQLDKKTCWCAVEYTQFTQDINRRYKMVKIDNYKDESRFLVLWCLETGLVDRLATES